jgi:hypothetical protein
MATPGTGTTRSGGTAGAPVSVRITNLNEWLRSMESSYKQAIDEAEGALETALRKWVYAPSQRLVPRDTGLLASTGYVSVTRSSSDRLRGSVGYDTDYAIYVHENPAAAHKAPTQWKFVEQPFSENVDQIADAVLAAVLKEFD